MGTCFLCLSDARVGGLCAGHVTGIATCRDIVAEQVISRAPARAQAWLIDQWGGSHPLASPTTLGRTLQEADVAILHRTVSVEHAVLARDGAHWTVRDRGSLNGTRVNGERVRSAPLTDGDVLAVGEVLLYFSDRPLDRLAVHGPGRTERVGTDDVGQVAVLVPSGGGSLRLSRRVEGGVLRAGEHVIELARLEFELLAALVQRRRDQRDPELAYMSWTELASSLHFKSRAADSENVRELVRRVRRKLQSIGVRALIDSRQGVGYRVAAEIQ